MLWFACLLIRYVVPERLPTLLTDSGMWAVWEPAYFSHVVDYESWEKELLEDSSILRQLNIGALVPINLHFDGAYEFELRIGDLEEQVTLSQREKQFLVVSSEIYKLNTRSKICVSGLEYIGQVIDEELTAHLTVPMNTYAVSIHMIEWDKEDGSKDITGNPSSTALPDFVILANQVSNKTNIKYVESLETFPNP